jgi:acetyl-CoA acetyltransferase family protein
MTQRIAIVGGARTPFVRAHGVLANKNFLDLGIASVKGLLDKVKIDPSEIDEIIYSTVLLDPRFGNAARELVIRSGLPASIPAHFISNNCISGLVAINMVAEGIKSGRLKVGLAGGSESMSQPALSFRREGEQFFMKLAKAKSLKEKLLLMTSFRPKMVTPIPPSPKEPSTGLTMGQHCELSAKEFAIPRIAQDELSFRSHQSAAKAAKSGYMAQEIIPVDNVSADNLVRADTTVEKLQTLKPVFDRSEQGTLTAGNSSALTDGASAVMLMSEAEANRRGLNILGFIESVVFTALHPKDGLLMAPGLAVPQLLHNAGLSVNDIDRFEIHEAFAAQVLANLQIWEKGWSKFPSIKPIGAIPKEKINVNGGSIALGHPFAATGGRLVTSLCNELQRNNLKRGVISVCAAGGMACAMLLTKN